jgi:DNA invertase Pin-like site-specific DNA recombinase
MVSVTRRGDRQCSVPHSEGRERAKARAVKMGRKPKLTDHRKAEAIKRRDKGEEAPTEIGRSDNVSGWTIARLNT